VSVSIVRIDFPYLKEDVDRHGNVRIYVRRRGAKVRIRASKGSPEFAKAYAEAIYALQNPTARKPARPGKEVPAGTMGALAADYFGSRRFKALDAVSQRRGHHRGVFARAAETRLLLDHCSLSPGVRHTRNGDDAHGSKGG
jgi:hypothetical protein